MNKHINVYPCIGEGAFPHTYGSVSAYSWSGTPIASLSGGEHQHTGPAPLY